jgi:hypothetical protein
MPLQNRVTPFGEVVETAERGLFTGNRGIIHDPETRTLLRRRWTTKAWITCTLDWKGVRRQPMAGRSWTELFFLDEATAFAAGHRPCFYCRRAAALAFRNAWAEGQGIASSRAPEIDAVLHDERLDERRRKKLHPLPGPIAGLPDGAMIAAGAAAYAIAGGKPLLWTAGGYRSAPASLRVDGLLTPPSIVAALGAGYRPGLHPSVRSA